VKLSDSYIFTIMLFIPYANSSQDRMHQRNIKLK